MMVEMFCGILSGAAYGPNVRQWLSNDGKPANLVSRIFNIFVVKCSEVCLFGLII